MITLKEALKLSKDELENLKTELKNKIEANPELNAYIDVNNVGDGVPIAIKDNIQVKNWCYFCFEHTSRLYCTL